MAIIKKHKYGYKFYVTISLLILMGITTLVSVGFSALNQNLSISGDLQYVGDNTLYGVLEKNANEGLYAKQYTGNHHDSFIENPTKNIYYWYGTNTSYNSLILDKWNVIFGGYCWQMIRTTDTGGVKLIYNGVPRDGKCNNTGPYQEIGESIFNSSGGSPAYVGYMYNKVYPYHLYGTDIDDIYVATEMNGSNNYYYGTGVTYSDDKYILTGVTQNTWTNTYSSSGGLYTCDSTSDTSCSEVYYIVGGTEDTMYGFMMEGSNMLDYYNTNITFGSGYTENNGTYTLTDTASVSKVNWANDYDDFNHAYTCGDNSTSCTNLRRVTHVDAYRYYYIYSDLSLYYSNSFSYSNGEYTLSNDKIKIWDFVNSSNRTSLNNSHYTCLNGSTSCSSIAYVYYLTEPDAANYYYYVLLEDGKSIDDAVDEMLYNDDVNTTDSIIKTNIDNWYSRNMTSYTNKLEDTVFCYDRTQSNKNDNGWNPNGGKVNTSMYFNQQTFLCQNDTDKFSVSNNKAKLTYPVGLPSYMEMIMLYNGDTSLIITGENYWLGTPHFFLYASSYQSNVPESNSSSGEGRVYKYNGVRPVVSLKPGTVYVSGEGSRDNPYVVD